MNQFEDIFGVPIQVSSDAPGRVNLLGEHTDYNDGFVLPTAIPQRTTVQMARSSDHNHHIYTADLDELIVIGPGRSPQSHNFASYVYGCIKLLQEERHAIDPMLVHINSEVPMGTGLSSSAALEVATLRALRQLFHLPLNDVEIAQIAQRAEIEYAHVNCGIMDQMACSLADTLHMLFLDTRSLESRVLPLPIGGEIVVIDSGIPRSLADSMYNQRRAECEHAASLLGVRALRDIQDPGQSINLPEPLRRRARHVITENNRVLQAVQSTSANDFGELMNQSHASLRDDYEVSIPALDTLVDILQHIPGVFGARLTGAGFGGACVALVEEGKGREIATLALRRYQDTGQAGAILVPV